MFDATWCARRRERLVQALKPQQTLWFDQPDSLRYLAGFHVDPFSLGSGYGGVFPPGLTLGTVIRAELGSDGLHKSGEVRLDERLGSLNEVTVLVPLNVETPLPAR